MFTARRMAAVAMRQRLLQPRITAASAYAAARPAVGLSMTRRAWETTATTPAAAATAEVPPSEADSTPVETITEEKATGHFEVKSNEAVLFFSSIFPLKVSSFILRPSETDHELADLMSRFNSSSLGIMDPIRMVKNAIPEDLPIKVTEVLPRLKDGGAFVKFKYPSNLDPFQIETDLRNRLNDKPIKPWFNPFTSIQARLVRGTPWLEDLYRFPSNFVKVEFVPAEVGGTPEQLSEENIYSLFRRFGKIGDIVAQPADSKELPRYATVNYPLTRNAIMARNCMHGFIVTEELGGGKSGTMLRLSYIKRIRAHNIWNWLTGHPRIVIPILAALLAGFSVMIFDPIRQFFIKLHIHHSLSFTESRVYKWFQTHRDSFRFGSKKESSEDLNNIWNHRKEVITQLEEWVAETSSNFIVVTGPKGTGKVELVMERALEGRKDVLLFDCKPIVEARGETATIKRLASTVGYRPVFSWANSISSLVDLAVQSTTGVKAGFSETLEAQLTKILYTTASALKDVGLCERSKKDKDATLSDDAYLEAHPERRPIVVIDNFLHKSDDNSVVYDKVSEWAASLVQNNAAQVIFITSDSTYSKPLGKALPDRVFRVVSLGDLEPDVARSFVKGRLDATRPPEDAPVEEGAKPRPSITLHGLDTAIETLGGRLMDLESLARRIQAGQSPRQATDEIVGECATDTVKMFLMGKSSDDVQKRWSTEQVWHLIKGLAKEPSLRYNQVLLSSTFSSSLNPAGSSGTAALESLAAADLISIKSSRGHPKLITAAKPVQQAAFGLLIDDRVLNAKMDLALMTELSKIEAKTIDSAENELALLGSLPRQTSETAGRIQYLLTKLDASQKKILVLERDIAGLKKVLSEED